MFPINVFADKSDDTLVAAFSRELTQLDYHYGTKTEFLILGDMIDSGLFYVNKEDLSYVPDIASDFKIVDDTTIDINLRKNAKFHDGSDVYCVRGGSWFTESDSTRSSARSKAKSDKSSDGIGLRLVWEPI